MIELFSNLGLFASWIYGLSFFYAGLPVKARDWGIYSWLLVLFPLSVILLNTFATRTKAGTFIKLGFAGVPALILWKIGNLKIWYFSLVMSTLQIGFMHRKHLADIFRKPSYLATRMYFLSVYWGIAAFLCYWKPNGIVGFIFSDRGLYRVPIAMFVGLMLLGLKAKERSPKTWAGIITIVVLFLLFAFPFPSGPDWTHHYSYFLGAAELVKQGRYLLWDVPSQYGFLSILSISFFPVGVTTVYKFWLLNCLFYGASCLLLSYSMFRIFKTRTLQIAGALFISLTVFFFPGMIYLGTGPYALPSVGPFRFFWPMALFGIILKILDLRDQDNPLSRRWEALGNGVWILCCFWSFECAVYASSAWGPALLSIIATDVQRRKKWATTAKRLLAPLFGLGACVLGLSVFYIWRIGHAPDWLGFFEYPRAYRNGFGSIDVQTPAFWTLGIFSTVILYALCEFIREKKWTSLPIAISGLTLFWTSISYFISRSADSNILNLLPLHLLILTGIFSLIERREEVVLNLKSALAPTFLTLFVLAVATPHVGRDLRWRIKSLGNVFHETDLVNDFSNSFEFEKLIGLAKLSYKQPVTYLGSSLFVFPERDPLTGSVVPLAQRFPQLGFPIAPEFHFTILPFARQKLYLDRALKKNHTPPGYLVFNDTTIDDMQTRIIDEGFMTELKNNYDFHLQARQEHLFLMKLELRRP